MSRQKRTFIKLFRTRSLLYQMITFISSKSALRSTENEFFRCESNIPKDLLYMLYNNSKYMSMPKNTRLDLGGDAENALYVLYEGLVKSQADQDILDEGIAIGCDI